MARVLVIEDDRFNRRLYRDLLEEERLEVEVASTAVEGLASARARPPALIVMDIELPDMDGLAATEALKADPTTAQVPILIVSAHALAHHEQRALAAGGAAFLRKPLSFPAFQEVVARLLALS